MFTTLSLLALSLLALKAQAQSSVIPYQGTLFSQGKPVSQNNPVKMAFALYSSDTGFPADQASAPPENREWRSWSVGGDQVNSNTDTVNVHVRNGRFLVHLGEENDGYQPLEESVFDTRPLYVVTWVVNNSGTFRLPPQKLEKVPHAVTAERAHEFHVEGSLRVNGSTVLNGLTQIVSSLLDISVGDVIPEASGCAESGTCGGGLKISGGGTGALFIDRNETYIQDTEGHTIRSGGGRIHFALPIQFNGGTVLTKLAFGVHGNCSSNGSAGSRGTINFTTFSSPPIVILTPYDASGCTTVRLTRVTTTSASFESWHTNNLAACNCIHWAALGK